MPSLLLSRGLRLSLALAALAAAVAASADVDKHAYSYSATLDINDHLFSLPKFDTTLGILQSVTFSMDASVASEIDLLNLSASKASDITGAEKSNFSLAEVGGQALTLSGSLQVTSGTHSFAKNPNKLAEYDTANNFGSKITGLSDKGSFSLTSTNASVLTEFTGPGLISLDLNAYGSHTTTATGGNNKVDYTTTGAANGFVIYNYAPQAVPEPASMAALGLGILGLVRRRSVKR